MVNFKCENEIESVCPDKLHYEMKGFICNLYNFMKTYTVQNLTQAKWNIYHLENTGSIPHLKMIQASLYELILIKCLRWQFEKRKIKVI